MSHLQDASEHQLELVAGQLAMAQAAMGFVPNALRIMARRPELLQEFLALAGALNGPAAILSACSPSATVRQLGNLIEDALASIDFAQNPVKSGS